VISRFLRRPLFTRRWQAVLFLAALAAAIFFLTGMNPIPPLVFAGYLLVVGVPAAMKGRRDRSSS
jgi:Mn2+/Fe2+ NRAMP family transporter